MTLSRASRQKIVPEQIVRTFDVDAHGAIARINVVREQYSLPHGRASWRIDVWAGWRLYQQVEHLPTQSDAERRAATIYATLTMRGAQALENREQL